MLLVGCGCNQAAPLVLPTPLAVASTSTPAPATATSAPRPAATPTRPVAAAPTRPVAANLQTFHAQISFDTYETEETVQLELGSLPGVSSVSVTQLEVTVQYDGARLTEDDILRTLRANPEVRVKDDNRAGR
jgi:copper chaperone CopZ